MAPLVTRGAVMAKMACKDCGAVGETETETKGHLFIELVLWLCFIIPGLIYSIWRHTNRRELCGVCGSDKVVPMASPIGQQLALSAGHAPEPPRQASAGAVGLGRSLGRLAGRLKP